MFVILAICISTCFPVSLLVSLSALPLIFLLPSLLASIPARLLMFLFACLPAPLLASFPASPIPPPSQPTGIPTCLPVNSFALCLPPHLPVCPLGPVLSPYTHLPVSLAATSLAFYPECVFT